MRIKIYKEVSSITSATPCKQYGKHLLSVVNTHGKTIYFDMGTAEQAEASANELYELGRTDLTGYKVVDFGD